MKNKICYTVIEDADDRDLLEAGIRETEFGYECIADKSIDRAKERFIRDPDFHPDYIFIDWNKDILQFIKKVPRLSNIPVIVYTANLNAEEIAEAKRLGAAHCVFITTHENALAHTLVHLFRGNASDFVMVYHHESTKGFMR